MNEKTTAPPPPDQLTTLDVLDSMQGDRITLVPIGPSLVFQIQQDWLDPPIDDSLLWIVESRRGELAVELEIPIDDDPHNAGVLLAWRSILTVFDPFQDAEPPTKWENVIDRMVEDALVEDFGTIYAS